MTVSNDLLFIRPNALTVQSNMLSCDIVAKAIERYQPIFFPPAFDLRAAPVDAGNILQHLTLNVNGINASCEKYIELQSNEACE